MTTPRLPTRARALARLAACTLAALPAAATAETSAERNVYMQAGASTSAWSGPWEDRADASLGFHLLQGVQLGWLGAYMRIGTDYRITTQEPPPFARGMQTFLLAPGLRFHTAVEPVKFAFGVEYDHLAILSNPLVRWTGDAANVPGFGTNAAARWMSGDALFGEVQLELRHFPGLREPVTELGVFLSVGMLGAF